jgi:pullulanase/glycogen debranching enzyme
MRIWPGKPYPLGATYDGAGTNFSLFSEVADKIELCFFDRNGKESRFLLPEVTGFCWRGYFPDVVPGQLYGYRVHGPWDPEKGLTCNPNKLLLDPYSKAIDGDVRWNEAVFSYYFKDSDGSFSHENSAPYHGYSSRGQTGQQVQEFKRMVHTLHQAGLEGILDVVYNHTAEGNHLGPMLCFKGIDNAAYYRLAAFFDIVQQDPVISQVKLIAEPWDIGEGGYQVGKFPPLWSEWNGKYRDCVRDFWRGENQTLGEFAYRFTGSSDLYERTGRRPYASVNFVTAHDGFTLQDLVAYNEKHNEENAEGNLDGEDHNRSWNCGVEGPTDDPQILALRARQMRNFLSSLFLSQGIPMLLGGDELGRTQLGNNNAYCQDNEISWFDWDLVDEDLLDFTRKLIHFRKEHPIFRRRGWFLGEALHGKEIEDICWFTPDGLEMEEEHWGEDFAKSIAVFLNGRGIHSADAFGQIVTDDNFLILFNAHYKQIVFKPPVLLFVETKGEDLCMN